MLTDWKTHNVHSGSVEFGRVTRSEATVQRVHEFVTFAVTLVPEYLP